MDNLATEDILASSSSIIDLPCELLDRILEYAPPSSLPHLRASCKTLKKLVDPLLWKTIRLYPHMECLRKVLALSTHPPVRQHVRQFVYDLRFASVVDLIAKRIQSVYSIRVNAEEKAASLGRLREASSGTLIPGRDDDIELLFLQDILRNLSSLENIYVLENSSDITDEDYLINIDDIPPYYQRLRKSTCGALPDTDLEPGEYSFRGQTRSAKRVLLAAYSIEGRVKGFHVGSAQWDYLTSFERDGKHLRLLSSFLGGLKSLTLDATFAGDMPRELLMANLGIVLNFAASLEALELRFGAFTADEPDYSDSEDEDEDEHNSDFVSSPLSIMERGNSDGAAGWGVGLKKLSLLDLDCSPSHLITVLERCAPTLRELSLEQFNLLPESGYKMRTATDPKPCLVKLFKEIRSILNLDKISLSGAFGNRGFQDWVLYPDDFCSNPSELLARTQRWILGADDCPLEGQAILEGNKDVTQQQLEKACEISDDSFEIHNSGPNSPHVDENPGFPPNILDAYVPIHPDPLVSLSAVENDDGLPTSPLYYARWTPENTVSEHDRMMPFQWINGEDRDIQGRYSYLGPGFV